MVNEFEYKGFEPDDFIKAEGEEVIDKIQDLVSDRVTIVALLEYENGIYSCSFDAIIRRGAIYASASDTDPLKALYRAEHVIHEKLLKHKETRFYTKKPEVLTNIMRNTFHLLKQT